MDLFLYGLFDTATNTTMGTGKMVGKQAQVNKWTQQREREQRRLKGGKG